MSDDVTSGTGDDAGADTASAPPTPSPRPRSAASRARRIGGAAASPRPDAATTEPTAGAATTTKDKAKAKDKDKAKDKNDTAGKAAPAVPLGKKAVATKASAGPATKRVKGGTEEADRTDAGSTRGAVTLSLPAWARWAPSFVFAAVAVVFLTLFAVARIGGDDAPASTSNTMRQQVLAAAKTCLATLNTYRYDQLDAAERAGVACTTGKLTSDYKETVTSVIRKNAPPLKAVQVAKINTAGIESVTKNGKQWTVLAYGQLNITTANTGKTGRQDPFAVVARLQQVKGKWVLSKIDTVSSATG